MGRYLAIGVKLQTAVRKEEISKHLEEASIEDILDQVETKYHLKDIYVRKEEEDYYVYRLDETLLNKEFIPFLEKFYALRYEEGDNYDASDVLDKLKSLPDTPARLAILDERRYQTFQEGSDFEYFRVNGSWNNELAISSSYAVLSIDGKIIMECYNDLFAFLRRCIMAQLTEFKISQALDIWLEG